MSLSPITSRSPGATIVLNGAPVGKVDVRPVALASLDSLRQAMAKDGKDHLFYTDPTVCLPRAKVQGQDATASCQPTTYVATGDQLTLSTFKKNILMVDGHRVNLIGVDDKIQTLGEGTKRTLRRLPLISSATTVGIVSAGAVGVAILRGARTPRSLLVTGVVAAGVAGAAAVGLSLFRAKHPDALPGRLK